MKFKELRKQTGLSQKELAAAIGVTQGTISLVERGVPSQKVVDTYIVRMYDAGLISEKHDTISNLLRLQKTLEEDEDWIVQLGDSSFDEWLAQEAGISVGYWKQIKRGVHTPNRKTLDKLDEVIVLHDPDHSFEMVGGELEMFDFSGVPFYALAE